MAMEVPGTVSSWRRLGARCGPPEGPLSGQFSGRAWVRVAGEEPSLHAHAARNYSRVIRVGTSR